MNITLKCFGIFRKYLPEGTHGNQAILMVPEEIDLEGFLIQLGVTEPHLAVFINGILAADRQISLQDESEVVLLQRTAGG